MANETHFLEEALIEDPLKVPFLFNGRVLSQEDLTQERVAHVERRRHLGRAVGSGVAFGLEVEPDLSASGPGNVVLLVAPGLGVAPDGGTLHLPQLVRLGLSAAPESLGVGASTNAADFDDCVPAASVTVPSTGLVLLVIRSAAARQGLAAVSGLGNEAAPCNAKYLAAGVRFRAVPFTVSTAATSPQFRSAVALSCFGFNETSLRSAVADPFTGSAPLESPLTAGAGSTPVPGYGCVDALRANGLLASCEVPLAVVHLDDTGSLGFVDAWSVRRALVRPPLSRHWWTMGGTDGRRVAEGEAAMLQFQDLIATLLAQTGLARESLPATTNFAFLPGGGFLPVGAGRFHAGTFLGGTASLISDADFGRLRELVHDSWLADAFDPASPPPISYFTFAEAQGRWVLFLRRKAEALIITDAPPSVPEPPVPDDIGEPPPPVEGAGTVLVILPRVRELLGDIEVQARASGQRPRVAEEISLQDAFRLQFGDTRVSPAERTRLRTARFFVFRDLPRGKYQISVRGTIDERPPTTTVTVEGEGVFPVTIL